LMILEVFSNLNDSMILSGLEWKKGSEAQHDLSRSQSHLLNDV